MKRTSILILLMTLSLDASADDYSLRGTWFNSEDMSGETIKFIKLGGVYHFTGKETFVFPYGELSHTIEQSVKIMATDTQEFTGTVDIFDSRGCSYKDLKVKGEFQSSDEVSFLITYPRYQVVKTIYPYSKIECKLLEFVETPFALQRKR